MKRKFHSVLACLLAVTLLLGLMSSCGTTPPAASDSATPSASASAKATPEASTTPEASAPAEDPIKWSGNISVASYMFGPLDQNLDFVGPGIEEGLKKYGYDITLEHVYIEYPQYVELMNTRIAGGNAPDIFLSMSLGNMREYYEQGAIKSWSKDFWMEHAPNLYAYFTNGGAQKDTQFTDMWWNMSLAPDDKDKMITVAGFNELGSLPYKDVTYRADWLEKLGVTEDKLPVTIEEFSDLMYRFAKEDPDGNGKNDTYGLSASTIRAIFGAYGNYNGFLGSDSIWMDEGGKLIDSNLMAGNKEALALLQKMYKDKVLDPEFVTGENQGGYWAIPQPFINGRFGVTCLGSIGHWRYPEVLGDEGGPVFKEYRAVNGPESTVTYGPWPAGPTGDYGYLIGIKPSVGENAVYNSAMDDEKLGVLLNIMDIFNQDLELAKLVQYGEEGKTFEVTDTGDIKMLLDNLGSNANGVWAYRSLYGANSPYHPDIQLAGLKSGDVMNRMNIHKGKQRNSYYVNLLTDTLPSDADVKADLKTYRDETWISIIKGDLPIDHWDAFVEEYNKRGGTVQTTEANEWYAKTK